MNLYKMISLFSLLIFVSCSDFWDEKRIEQEAIKEFSLLIESKQKDFLKPLAYKSYYNRLLRENGREHYKIYQKDNEALVEINWFVPDWEKLYFAFDRNVAFEHTYEKFKAFVKMHKTQSFNYVHKKYIFIFKKDNGQWRLIASNSGLEKEFLLLKMRHLLETHYIKLFECDDEYSKKVFHTMFYVFDSDKLFFTQKEYEYFKKKYEYTLDDELLSLNYTMYKELKDLYQKRWEEFHKYIENAQISEEKHYTLKHQNYASDENMLKKRWQNYFMQIYKARNASSEYQETLKTMKKIIELRYENEDLFARYLKAHLKALDGFSDYYSAKAKEKFIDDIESQENSFPWKLEFEDKETIVRYLYPQKDQGIKVGDRIEALKYKGEVISSSSYYFWYLYQKEDALEFLIKNKAWIKLEKTQKIPGDEVRFVEIQRNKKFYLLIDIPSFYGNLDKSNRLKTVSRDIVNYFMRYKVNHYEGIIIDLRGNGGGLLSEAINVAQIFSSGAVIQTYSPKEGKQIHSADMPAFVHAPLAVLIDDMSASASEIFTSMIQDTNRGLIIGEDSFGKGTVQMVFDDFSDISLYQDVNKVFNKDVGLIKLTVAGFFRLDGNSINYNSIKPDIYIPKRKRIYEFVRNLYPLELKRLPSIMNAERIPQVQVRHAYVNLVNEYNELIVNSFYQQELSQKDFDSALVRLVEIKEELEKIKYNHKSILLKVGSQFINDEAYYLYYRSLYDESYANDIDLHYALDFLE